MDLRDEFEKGVVSVGKPDKLRKDEAGLYVNVYTELQWQAYQAATLATARKCAEICKYDRPVDSVYEEGVNAGCNWAADRIRREFGIEG